MEDNQSSRLSIRFESEFRNLTPGNSLDNYFIPASMFGQVIASVNDMMLHAWEYAIRNTEDDRLRHFASSKLMRSYRKKT
jgi:hypothetical protein